MAGAVPTYAEMLNEAKLAYMRLLKGATSVSVNGQQFVFWRPDVLLTHIHELEVRVAEAAGTDGRGAWEATFAD